MTAIVGILNKQAIAVAADSAVTVGGGMKIYNTANKIFTLSKRHPVGVAIYNNASYNGCVPWEVVIKMYRNQLQDKTFPTVKEYASDLISYLDDFRSKYYRQEDLNKVLSSEVFTFWMMNVIQHLPHNNWQSATIQKEDLPALKNNIKVLKEDLLKTEPISQIKDVSIESFKSSVNDIWPKIRNQIEAVGGDYHKLVNDIEELLFLAFTRKKFEHPSYSGLAVFGYGEDEVYPALHEYWIHNTFVDKPFVEERTSAIVSEPPADAFIHPMAQVDVIRTYIEGISPQIESTFIESTVRTLHSTLEIIGNLAATKDRNLARQIKSIDLTPVIQSYANTIQQFKQSRIVSPLISTIASMGKEDIAELAENLIYVTSMKRHITPNLESVGGPVDVAVVSKGDGFIWMKRKHYFDPQLNNCFFENYFEK